MMDSSEEHFVGKVAQKAIIYKGDYVLLIRDPREENEIWELPGGRLNVGESSEAGLARELREELGVEVQIKQVVHVGQFLHVSEGRHALVIVYEATLASPEEAFKLDLHEIAEARFVPVGEVLSYKLFPEYREALAVFIKKYQA